MPLITEMKDDSATLVADRRRPGRLSKVNPDLIPILRGEEGGELPEGPLEFLEDDQLSAARGMFFGVLLSAPLWVGIAFVGRWLLS